MKGIAHYLPAHAQTGRKLSSKKGLAIHWVANPKSSARGNINYWKTLSNGIQAHDVIDLNGDLLHAVPYDIMCYHLGSKTYTRDALNRLGSYPNNCMIGIECTHLDWTGKMTDPTYRTLVQHSADLCKQFGWTVDDIWLHQEVVGWKDCHRWFVNNINTHWVRFLSEVQAEMSDKSTTRDPVNTNDIEMVEYLDLWDKGSEVKEAQLDLQQLGFYKGEIDSSFGPIMLKAVEDFQRSRKIVIDGVIGVSTRKEIEEALDELEKSKIWYRIRRIPNDAKSQLIATRDKDKGLAYAKEKKAYLLEGDELKVLYTPVSAPKPKPAKPVVKKPSIPKSLTDDVGKGVRSTTEGLRFYSKPSWEDKDVTGHLKKGYGFPTIVAVVAIGGGHQYKVKNSNGATFYMTTNPSLVDVYQDAPPAPKKAAPAPKPVSKSIVPYPGKALVVGSTGKDVERVQRAVGANPDGRFGPATKAKVQAYQSRVGLTPDGSVGPATWAMMF